MEKPGNPVFLLSAFESKWSYLPIQPGNNCRTGQKLPGGSCRSALSRPADFAGPRKNDD
jgi:hypothetical protein